MMLNLIAPPLSKECDEAIQQLLSAVRTHLGMDVAFVSEIVDGHALFRHVDAPGHETLIKVGDSQPLNDTYCGHVLEGSLPPLIANTADYPIAQALPVTAAMPIGAYASVPIRLPDGTVHGMFCCLSARANRTLNQRDLGVMRVFADLAAHQISGRVGAEQASQARRARIREMIDTGAFSMVFQPIMRFEPDRIVGFEALCRFAGHVHLSPELWFKEAAQEGCGVELELRVLDRALGALPDLPDETYLSVNVSPEAVMNDELRRLLLRQTTHRVVLEITEHAEVADYAALRQALAPLRHAGARLAVDDAGAGFASFQHILQLQPDIIKLDIGLTRGLDADPSRRALTAALAYFAADIGATIVAEGVETESELRTLKSLGVQNGQGYFLGRPAPLPSATITPARVA
jgi:EAL domain-containing protein (putative c-di-GMP-specific phosphodiesterase class I)